MSDLPNALPASLLDLPGPVMRAACHAFGHSTLPYNATSEYMIPYLRERMLNNRSLWLEVKAAFVRRLLDLVSTQARNCIMLTLAATARHIEVLEALLNSMRNKRANGFQGAQWQ